MDELKPCPFCGKKPKLISLFESGVFCVRHTCRSFGAVVLIIDSTLFASQEDAIEAWNRRSNDVR